MGCICSKSSSEDGGGESEVFKEASKSSVQVVTPSNKDELVVHIINGKSDGDVDSMFKHGIMQPPQPAVAAAKMVQEDSKTRIIERPKEGHKRRSTYDMENGDIAQNQAMSQTRINSTPGGVETEQIAAGWPSWLTSVASEAIIGWVPRSAESYEKLNKIGQGTYSSVYKARDLKTGKIVAMKKVRFVNMDPESVRFMAREITILRRLDHPNIMKLEALVTSRMSGSLYLVFEYMEHDLSGLAANPKIKFTESQIKCYMKQLLCGLEHCHSRGILHRDIKGSNLLVDNNGVLKIGDFGLATFYKPDKKQPLTSRVVTLWYRAPELLLGATEYGVAIDMWSAGCILAELFAGKPIMPGRTEVEQMHKIFKLCGSPSEEYWRKSKLPHTTSFKPQQPYERRVTETFKDFPSSALSLIDILLAVEPEQRGNAASALSHEFFTTKPLPCDPSSLPKYPPSKELDAKLREEETRRKKVDPGKTRGPEFVRRDTKGSSGQGQSNKSTSVKFNPQEDSGTGFPIEPPRGKAKNGFSHSSSMIHPSAGYTSWSKKVIDDSCHTGMGTTYGSTRHDSLLSRQRSHMSQVAIDLSLNKPKKDEIANSTENMGYVPKRNRLHYSGPLMAPGGNMEDMLKEHERQIQEAVRKARVDKDRTKKTSFG